MAKLRTSAFVGEMSGRMDRVVYVNSTYGQLIREFTSPTNPRTAVQQAWRKAFGEATRAWRQLTPEQASEWDDYAASLVPTGERPPTGVNTYVQLVTRVLAINPTAPIPTIPPETAFGGDGVAVTVTANSSGIIFTPNQPNTSGVITELLVLRLASHNNRITPRNYRVKARVTFGGPQTVSLGPGWYACAVRYVRAATGQCTAVLPIGRVQVA